MCYAQYVQNRQVALIWTGRASAHGGERSSALAGSQRQRVLECRNWRETEQRQERERERERRGCRGACVPACDTTTPQRRFSSLSDPGPHVHSRAASTWATVLQFAPEGRREQASNAGDRTPFATTAGLRLRTGRSRPRHARQLDEASGPTRPDSDAAIHTGTASARASHGAASPHIFMARARLTVSPAAAALSHRRSALTCIRAKQLQPPASTSPPPLDTTDALPFSWCRLPRPSHLHSARGSPPPLARN